MKSKIIGIAVTAIAILGILWIVLSRFNTIGSKAEDIGVGFNNTIEITENYTV